MMEPHTGRDEKIPDFQTTCCTSPFHNFRIKMGIAEAAPPPEEVGHNLYGTLIEDTPS